ncbi:unnamed protein product [Linum trigynum]|uniref:Uncharacterized protein n=1 Tax=Linum trigynum TaxID=586398 RepID=A0AAV2GUZ5_9ROSI
MKKKNGRQGKQRRKNHTFLWLALLTPSLPLVSLSQQRRSASSLPAPRRSASPATGDQHHRRPRPPQQPNTIGNSSSPAIEGIVVHSRAAPEEKPRKRSFVGRSQPRRAGGERGASLVVHWLVSSSFRLPRLQIPSGGGGVAVPASLSPPSTSCQGKR